jgi:hypothetical protein
MESGFFAWDRTLDEGRSTAADAGPDGVVPRLKPAAPARSASMYRGEAAAYRTAARTIR